MLLLAPSELPCEPLCTLWLSFLRPLVKRCRHHLRTNALSANQHLERRTYGRKLQGHICQRDILLQEWRGRSASDVSNFLPTAVQHLVLIARDAALRHFQTHERTLDTRCLRLLQSRAPNELRLLHLAEAVEAGFPHIDRIGNLVPVERQLAFEAQRIACAQSAGHDAEFLTRSQNLIPHPSACRLIRRNVDLEAVFGGVAGARDENILQATDASTRHPIK